MVDSKSVAVGGEVAAWVTDLVVVPERSGEREQPEPDARSEAWEGAGAAGGHEGLKFSAGEAFVGDDAVAVERHSVEHLARNVALGDIGRGELEGDRGAVARAKQIEPKTPEEAGMRAAVAVGGIAGELRTTGRLARLATGNRGRVEQPEPVTEGRRDESEVADRAPDLGNELAQPLVVAGLLGQIGEQMPEPIARQREELAVVRQPKQDLRDGERDQLSVVDSWWPARPFTSGQEVIHQHINCREKGVEVGAHEASLVDVAIATPDFGTLRAASSQPNDNSESTI